ncbi:MAG: thioredoxin family protein [Desulfomonilia bacterium]|jgi:hypothetical protein
MPGPEIVTRIRIDTIESVLREEKTVFVACIRDDIDYQETMGEIESVALFAGPNLKVCYVLEDLLPYFEKRFSVSGTPSFLIIKNGDLLDSILGKISAQGLMDFIRPHVPDLLDRVPLFEISGARIMASKRRGII